MKPYFESPVTRLYQADARALPLEDESIHTVVTSPPYWGLRDYGIEPSVWETPNGMASDETEHEWTSEGQLPSRDRQHLKELGERDGSHGGAKHSKGDQYGGNAGSFCWKCGAWRGTLGLEPTPKLYVEHMVEVFREVWRVLRPDGTLWLNLGDSYAGSWGNYHPFGEGGQLSKQTERWERPGYADTHRRPPAAKTLPGLKPKDLVGIPWRVAFALQADGWWLRSDIIWSKPNPMPESVTDRPTKAHEYLFLLTKAERYYYDADAIREPATDAGREHGRNGRREYQDERRHPPDSSPQNLARSDFRERGRNKRTVWEIATQPYPEAHFATFPEALVEPCILAGTSERGVCAECGAPWKRVVERVETGETQKMTDGWDTGAGAHGTIHRKGQEAGESGKPVMANTTTGWTRTCDHEGDPVPATVLDPFAGSGTVSAVAQGLGRHSKGVDKKRQYLDLAVQRISKVPLPMTTLT